MLDFEMTWAAMKDALDKKSTLISMLIDTIANLAMLATKISKKIRDALLKAKEQIDAVGKDSK